MMCVAVGDISESRHWIKAVEGKVSNKEWVDFFEGRGFRGGVDAPTCFFFE